MIKRENAPEVVRVYADNGEHSHFKLIDVETGATLWQESETADNTDLTKKPTVYEFGEYCIKNGIAPSLAADMYASFFAKS